LGLRRDIGQDYDRVIVSLFGAVPFMPQMQRLYTSRRLAIVRGFPAYADSWCRDGKFPVFAIRRAPKGGGLHIICLGLCLGIKLS
jgi:hypothetical protein